MHAFKRLFLAILAAILIVVTVGFVFNNWGFVFSDTVDGEIIGVERVTPPVAILGSGSPTTATAGLFSFAIAVRDGNGVIHSASSEDRQWAIAKPGFCVTAVFYPYAPWKLNKEGTYSNARLIQLRDCAKKTSAPSAEAPATTTGDAQ